jgi:cobalamin-dependent methionine synthase I
VVIARLKTMLHKQNTTTNAKGPVVIVGCAPDEFHEIGALIVSFFMSLNGWKVLHHLHLTTSLRTIILMHPVMGFSNINMSSHIINKQRLAHDVNSSGYDSAR